MNTERQRVVAAAECDGEQYEQQDIKLGRKKVLILLRYRGFLLESIVILAVAELVLAILMMMMMMMMMWMMMIESATTTNE